MDWQPVHEPGRAWQDTPKSLRPLGGWVIGLTAFLLVGQVVQVVLLRQFSAVGSAAPDLGDSLRQMAVAVPFMLLNIGQTVVALVWMHRASANVTKYGMHDRQWGPGWAVGSWFIPLANFVLPLFALIEIWKGSRPDAQPGTWRHAPVPALLIVLWICWVASFVVSFTSALVAGFSNAFSGEEAAVPLGATFAQTALYLAAGVLFILFVRQVGQMQAHRGGGMPARPTYS